MLRSVLTNIRTKNMRIVSAFFLSAFILLTPSNSTAQERELGQRTQETIPVGDNRFLIYVGAQNEDVIGYTVDMIKIDNGIPFYVPLFIEDYDIATNSVDLSYGVAFFAHNYIFERDTKIMTIKTFGKSKTLYALRYRLDDDIFHLLSVTAIEQNGQSTMIFQASPKPVKP